MKQPPKRKCIWAAALAVVLLAGCASRPEPEAPPLPFLDGAAAFVEAPEGADTAWVATLAHPELADLIEEAWAANPGLQRLAARLAQAEAEARIAGAFRQPQIGVGGEGGRQEAEIAGFGRVRETRYAVSGNVSWEIDLWGRLRDRRSAAQAALGATEADFAGARLSLAAQAVRLWVETAEASTQIDLAENTVALFDQTERLTRRRFEAGVADAVEVRLARANTAAARSAVEARKRQSDALKRALETVLGRYPAGTFATKPLGEAPAPIDPGIPADLLTRRPDLRAAEARYAAAVFGLSAAEKARLPEIRLTAVGGLASTELSDLLSSDRFFWNLVGGLTAPLFDGGRLSAEQDRARAQAEEAAHAYAETVLTALREVETALAAERLLREQETALDDAVTQAREAERLAAERYARGLTPLTTVLEAQRRAFESESQQLTIRAERHRTRIDLILALGGNFLPPSP
jgi:multidrug efflux system outer membrane protein